MAPDIMAPFLQHPENIVPALWGPYKLAPEKRLTKIVINNSKSNVPNIFMCKFLINTNLYCGAKRAHVHATQHAHYASMVNCYSIEVKDAH